MNLEVICDDCKTKFAINPDMIHKEKRNFNGESIWLTYYDCQVCKKRYFVQIDNVITNKMFADCAKQMIRLSKKKVRSQKQVDDLRRMMLDLDKARIDLMSKYANEIDFTLINQKECLSSLVKPKVPEVL